MQEVFAVAPERISTVTTVYPYCLETEAPVPEGFEAVLTTVDPYCLETEAPDLEGFDAVFLCKSTRP